MLEILEKKSGLWPFWLIFEGDFEKIYENRRFDQKSEIQESGKSGFGDLSPSMAPPQFTEASNLLKHSSNLFRMDTGEFIYIWLSFNVVDWSSLCF